MDVWPAGLSISCFYQERLTRCLEITKEAGFDLIQICSIRLVPTIILGRCYPRPEADLRSKTVLGIRQLAVFKGKKAFVSTETTAAAVTAANCFIVFCRRFINR